jgi:hypothetical protein
MKTKPPPDRRKFAGAWDEIEHLYQKVLYWLYQRENVNKAQPFAARLERILASADPDESAILGAECRSLIHEARGELQKAIDYRRKEIRLIRKLQNLAQHSPDQGFLLRGYGYGDLSDRLDLLAVLHHANGDVGKAIDTLRESQRICDAHGMSFNGSDLLKEYMEESQRRQAGASEKHRQRGSGRGLASPRGS